MKQVSYFSLKAEHSGAREADIVVVVGSLSVGV